MQLHSSRSSMLELIHSYQKQKLTIGFVPTMGALHEGHLSLVKKAKTENDKVIVSIFVNPTQFNNPNDLEAYPQPIKEDTTLLESVATDALFHPTVQEMYPTNYTKHTNIHTNLGGLDKVLEGKFRPGHFQGVVEVVSILFDIIQPNKAYFGKKDFQQLAILQQLAKNEYPTLQILPCETTRASNGLALSSRNQRLTPAQREDAGCIYQTLVRLENHVQKRDNLAVEKELSRRNLEKNGYEVEYIAIVDSFSLQEKGQLEIQLGDYITIAIAVWVAGVRLIDNIQFRVNELL